MVVPEEALLYGGMVAGIFGRYVVNVMWVCAMFLAPFPQVTCGTA